MSDLISRSELLNAFNNTNIQITFDLPVEEVFVRLVKDAVQANNKMVIDTIKNQPTAYSVDKVIEELEQHYGDDSVIGGLVYSDGIKKAIEIIKQGGVYEAEQKLKEMECD